MSTAFASIQAALQAALSAAPALAGGRISANRVRPIPAGQATAIVLRLEQSAGDDSVMGLTAWQTAYTIECYGRASVGSDPSGAVDALLSDTWDRLAGIDLSAQGTSISLQPQIDWQYDDTDTPQACAVIRLTAQHYTTQATLQAAP